MKTRLHIVLDEREKERFRMSAERRGQSLSAWLRDAARERLRAEEDRPRLDTLRDLRAFFAACDERESGREPEWEEHRRVIEESRRPGRGEP